MNHGTQTITRQDVTPGMLIIHEGKTWTASANTNGNLYIRRLSEAKRINDSEIEVFLDTKQNIQIHQ